MGFFHSALAAFGGRLAQALGFLQWHYRNIPKGYWEYPGIDIWGEPPI